MKKSAIFRFSLGVSTLAIVGCGTQSPNTNTKKLPPTNASQAKSSSSHFMPASITFANSDTGFVSGDIVNGNSSTGCVYKTTDGGRTWEKLLQKGTVVSNVSVFGHDLWMDVTDQQNGGLYFSKDDGQTIDRISSMSLSGIDFTSRNVGWAVSQKDHFDTVITKTIDGGKQWSQVHLPSMNEQQLPSGGGTFISFTNPQNGFLLIAGQPAAGQQPKALLQTKDGGQTWTSVFNTNTDAKSQRNQLTGGYADGIDAVPSHPSYAYLWESRGPLLYTSDGGKSWHASAVTKPTVIEVRGVSMQTVNDGFVLLQDMDHSDFILEHTTDNGINWQMVYEWSYS